jgi:hypothetical protein
MNRFRDTNPLSRKRQEGVTGFDLHTDITLDFTGVLQVNTAAQAWPRIEFVVTYILSGRFVF